MLYFLAFLFYYDDKQQLRWPSEENTRIRNCRLGYHFESGETKDVKISIYSKLVVMMIFHHLF